MKPAALIALSVVCALLPTSPAVAAYDPIASGTVSLTLDKGFESYLRKAGVKMGVVAPAKRAGKRLVLPVSGGKADPLVGKGTAMTEGGFVLSNARGRVVFRSVMVKPKPTPLYAKVGGGQLKVATSSTVKARRAGFGNRWSIAKLKLSDKVVTRLNKKLRTPIAFEAGQALGSLTAATQPETVTIEPRLRVSLAPTPQILAKFQALFVSLNPVAPAELAPGPVFTFPILPESVLSTDASRGMLKIGGDMELLQLGGGQIFWHEDWLDFLARNVTSEVNVLPSPPYVGKAGRIGVFDMGAGSVLADSRMRTIDVTGLPLSLHEGTARALNDAFAEGKSVFTPGEQLGTVSFKAAGQ